MAHTHAVGRTGTLTHSCTRRWTHGDPHTLMHTALPLPTAHPRYSTVPPAVSSHGVSYHGGARQGPLTPCFCPLTGRLPTRPQKGVPSRYAGSGAKAPLPKGGRWSGMAMPCLPSSPWSGKKWMVGPVELAMAVAPPSPPGSISGARPRPARQEVLCARGKEDSPEPGRGLKTALLSSGWRGSQPMVDVGALSHALSKQGTAGGPVSGLLGHPEAPKEAWAESSGAQGGELCLGQGLPHRARSQGEGGAEAWP